MGNTYSTGGTNSTTQTYSSSTTISGGQYTVTNTSDGQFLFTPSAARIVNFYGNLTNEGLVSFIPSTTGTGSTFNLGTSSLSTLTQTDGKIVYKQLDATSGSSIYLQYGTISNDVNSTIDLESAGASTISAPYVTSLTNAGTIKVVDTSGTGMTSNWGAGSGTFTNTGSFSIDDSAATSGSTSNLNFSGIQNTGTVSFNVPGSSTSVTTVGSGGFENDGTWSYTSTNTSGNIQIQGGTGNYINNGTLNLTDANLTVANNLTSSDGQTGTINLSNGGSLKLNNSASSQDINMAGSGNSLDFVTFANAAAFTGEIRGFTKGDQINVGSTITSSSYDPTTGILSLTTAAGSLTLDVGTGYTQDDFKINTNGSDQSASGWLEACFLKGSMISTPEGKVAVEDLKIGDQVITFDWKNNQHVARPIVWVGKAHTTARIDLPDDEAGWPVRILKDAVADGVPYKDMLVTAEHCMFFMGKFVPVRMLVNGISIFYDKSISSYDYYHVETEEHSVITADGMMTESYLDTGNRSSFRQEGNVVALHSVAKSWAEDAGAPLCVDRSFVEPLFRMLEWRENDLIGCRIRPEKSEITHNPDLHLITANGATIRPMRHSGQQYSFMLPPNTGSIRIVSRASRPVDAIGPFVDDRRYMGVAVSDVHLLSARQSYSITAHLQAQKPQGWHDTDWTDCAWTNGDAVLPLEGCLTQGKISILTITVRAAGPYLVNEQHTVGMKACSA